MTRDDARLAEIYHLTRRAATIRAMGEDPSCDDWDADCVSEIDTALPDGPGSADVVGTVALVACLAVAVWLALRMAGVL